MPPVSRQSKGRSGRCTNPQSSAVARQRCFERRAGNLTVAIIKLVRDETAVRMSVRRRQHKRHLPLYEGRVPCRVKLLPAVRSNASPLFQPILNNVLRFGSSSSLTHNVCAMPSTYYHWHVDVASSVIAPKAFGIIHVNCLQSYDSFILMLA